MKKFHIEASLFQKNRAKLTGLIGEGNVACFCSSGMVVKSRDQHYPFRQHSNFYYLTGLDEPDIKLFLAPNHPKKHFREVLFIKETTPYQLIWDGPRYSKEMVRNISGVKTVFYESEWDQFLSQEVGEQTKIYVDYDKVEPHESRSLTSQWLMFCALRSTFKKHAFENLTDAFVQLRLKKEPEEIKAIKQAIQITKIAFEAAAKCIHPGTKEYEIEALLEYQFMLNGANGKAFDTIVASGANACILHYLKNNEVMQDGELTLLDFGSAYGYYTSDCSRTLPVNGRFSDHQKYLYETVLEAFLFGRSLMKPGITITEINDKVENYFGPEHVRFGLYEKASKENIKRFFPHGTSHFMGLDVHDVGNKEVKLEPGMVLTCEPGIYIPEQGIGIRIENDILVTGEEPLDLMSEFAIEVSDIEDLMRHD